MLALLRIISSIPFEYLLTSIWGARAIIIRYFLGLHFGADLEFQLFLHDRFIDYSSSTLYKVILQCTDHCKADFSLDA
jgi:hypothetical protein